MKNEPKEIYLFCYDERETNPEYLPKDDDFQSLDSEFVNWGETKNEGCYDVKYVHHSISDALLEAAQDFVNKVETGRARSTDSYAKFKAAISKALGI